MANIERAIIAAVALFVLIAFVVFIDTDHSWVVLP